jgi:hypothetical protein
VATRSRHRGTCNIRQAGLIKNIFLFSDAIMPEHQNY